MIAVSEYAAYPVLAISTVAMHPPSVMEATPDGAEGRIRAPALVQGGIRTPLRSRSRVGRQSPVASRRPGQAERVCTALRMRRFGLESARPLSIKGGEMSKELLAIALGTAATIGVAH